MKFNFDELVWVCVFDYVCFGTVPRPIRRCTNPEGFCGENEAGLCHAYHAPPGCNQCNYGTFKKSYNHPCVNCQNIFGNACDKCNDDFGPPKYDQIKKKTYHLIWLDEYFVVLNTKMLKIGVDMKKVKLNLNNRFWCKDASGMQKYLKW